MLLDKVTLLTEERMESNSILWDGNPVITGIEIISDPFLLHFIFSFSHYLWPYKIPFILACTSITHNTGITNHYLFMQNFADAVCCWKKPENGIQITRWLQWAFKRFCMLPSPQANNGPLFSVGLYYVSPWRACCCPSFWNSFPSHLCHSTTSPRWSFALSLSATYRGIRPTWRCSPFFPVL